MPDDDSSILIRTKLALAGDERSGLVDVQVEVVDRVIYLRGSVASEEERLAAVTVSAGVVGVRAVCCELFLLRVKPPTHERLLPRGRPGSGAEGESFLE